MQILITEEQLNLLTSSEVEGLSDFMDTIISKYPEIDEHKEHIINFINKSGCKKIEFGNMNYGAGLSLHDSVLLNKTLLTQQSMDMMLFVVFHEIAHQYQFKKYGAEKMYELYTGKLSIEDGITFLYETEITADEFALRKCREFIKLGLLKSIPSQGVYKKMSKDQLLALYNGVQRILSARKGDSPEEVSEVIYNFIKIKLE
jgi:hypothetical protein